VEHDPDLGQSLKLHVFGTLLTFAFVVTFEQHPQNADELSIADAVFDEDQIDLKRFEHPVDVAANGKREDLDIRRADHLGQERRLFAGFSARPSAWRPLVALGAGLPAAIADAQADNRAVAAEGIMTTDTLPKAFSKQVTLGGQTVTITGISKGAGMIKPNMATMLGFLATDANVAPALLQGLVTDAANASFNRITIDGDTSTNDSFVLIATRKAAHAEITDVNSPDGQALRAALIEVSQKLAQAIVRDGEGATKFISVTIEGGRTEAECALAAYAIAHSPLVKTAFFASDPNLGRILAAVGYAGIDDLDQNLIEMHLDDVHVVTKGGRNPAYREEDGQRIMKQSEITIRVNLGRGQAATTVWTCDLSHDYVSINADYRS